AMAGVARHHDPDRRSGRAAAPGRGARPRLMSSARPTPLDGVRVIDTADGPCGRFLADLGADVIRVEPPGGAPARARAPLRFALQNAGKRGVAIDDREQLLRLLDGADI